MRGLPAAKLYRPGRDNRAPWPQIGRAPVLVRAKRGLPINTPTARHCPWALAGNAARYQAFVFNFAGTWESIYLILILILILTGRRAAGPTAAFLPVRGPSKTSPRRHAMCHGWPRSLSRVDLFKSELSIISKFQKHHRVIKETSRDDPNNRERPARGDPRAIFQSFGSCPGVRVRPRRGSRQIR